jgi:Tol biopolymer transport system component
MDETVHFPGIVAPVICSVIHLPHPHQEDLIVNPVCRRWIILSCASLLAGSGEAQTFFSDVTQEAIRVPLNEARSTAFGDYNNDGWPDFILAEDYTSSHNRIWLLSNEGNGRFANQTAAIQEKIPAKEKGGGAVFGDYDNDGDQDLLVPIGGFLVTGLNMLLRNDRGVFKEVNLLAGLADQFATDNAIWLDYNRDGYLDLYMGNPYAQNILYRNNRDGTFTDATEETGLDVELSPAGGSNGGIAAGDFNGDGWADLFVTVWDEPNRLFLSDGKGSFADATTDEIADPGQAYGVAVGDINNDGDLDLFHAAFGFGDILYRSELFLNLGGGEFLDVTEAVGLSALDAAQLLGANFGDIDNDGDLDLLTMNTHFLYLNNGDGTFSDRTSASGMIEVGGTLSFGDYDLDGFLDVLLGSDSSMAGEETSAALYRNNGNGNHWLRVELVGVESNRNGIGARLFATAGDLRQMREILGGLGFNQDEMVAHFGLGERTQVDQLEIRWPSGQVDVLTDIPADQKIRIIEGKQTYHVVHPTVWESFPPDSLVVGSMVDLKVAVRPALFEPDATLTRVTADLSELGGPADLPLRLDEQGVYRLESSPEIDGLQGSYTVYVNIEQQTFLGDHWIQLSRTLVVLPDEGIGLFGGAGEENWTWHGQDLMRVTDHPGSDIVASWSPDGTKFAFFTDRDGNWEIYVMDADGSHPVNLTQDPGNDFWPSWSPDGTKIAFMSKWDNDDDFEIYVIDADGSYPVNLTMTEGKDDTPSWSPDGTKIAFSTNRDGNFEIYVVDADGSHPVNLTNNDDDDFSPSWSPDGKRIAFQSFREGDGEVYVLDLETGNVAKLTHGWVAPASAWSPDGSRIVFESDRSGNLEIYVIDADGGDPIRITHHPEGDMNVGWSPDGSRIAFASDRTGNWDLFILHMGDTSQVEIDPQERETVFAGSEALAVRAGSDWWLSCQPDAPFDWTGYAALSFAFHPGDLSASTGEEFSVWIRGKEVDLLAEGWVDLAEKKWQVVEIPFEQFELKEPIEAIDFSGDFTGSFHIDDLRLVPAKPSSSESTAVTEEHAAGQPLTFSLEQNYPNPFNAATVIRFALPTAANVELAIFNLAGQKVTTLVQGAREAGTYTINWDGRDDDGPALASGVFLYRLRTGDGQQVETRKLVLVR